MADCSLPLPHAIFDSKVLGSKNHDALGIERCPTSTVGVIGLLPEVFLAARFHIFHQNGNKEVPVRSRLLVHSSWRDSIILWRLFRNINLAHAASYGEYFQWRDIQGIQGWFSGLVPQLGVQHRRNSQSHPWLCRSDELLESPRPPPCILKSIYPLLAPQVLL